MKKNSETLNWRFDVSTFKLLGRELITDRITAVFELVKNSYDANAEEVTVEFCNVDEISENSKIIIKDDGMGMSLDEIKNNWMVIGTSSKRKKTKSEPPYERVFIGEKGIGRFAVEKLGSKLLMRTKKEHQQHLSVLEVDWDAYEDLSHKQLDLFEQDEMKYFTDIDNRYWIETAADETKMTELIITDIREAWTEYDLERLYKELSKLISPFGKINYPFKMTIKSDAYKKYCNKNVESISVDDFATVTFSLSYDMEDGRQDVIKHRDGKLVKETNDISQFGPIKFNLYYFDQSAKNKFNKCYPKGTPFYHFIDGIKIYRDGIITTPFAEYEAKQDNKRDVLGIDKRRYSGFFDKVNSRDMIGIVEITKEYNPEIIDSTNRQDFLDNEAYRLLKDFIIHQITQLEEYLKEQKREKRKQIDTGLETAKVNVQIFTKTIKETKRKSPELAPLLDPIAEQAKEIKAAINQGLKDKKQLEKEKKRQENLFHSLMSLQEYAHEMADIVRNSLATMKRRAQYFTKYFPDPSKETRFKQYADQIYEELMKLTKAIDFMQSYTKSNLDYELINIKELIDNLFNDAYEDIFKEENIKAIIEIDESLILRHNRKFLEDIFTSLITNSIKALKNANDKRIKCSSIVNEEEFIIYFSDNGIGIKKNIHDKIFTMFFTTTAEEGGAGVGLYTVKRRVESLKGSIEVAENEFQAGATFKITIPFNRS